MKYRIIEVTSNFMGTKDTSYYVESRSDWWPFWSTVTECDVTSRGNIYWKTKWFSNSQKATQFITDTINKRKIKKVKPRVLRIFDEKHFK